MASLSPNIAEQFMRASDFNFNGSNFNDFGNHWQNSVSYDKKIQLNNYLKSFGYNEQDFPDLLSQMTSGAPWGGANRGTLGNPQATLAQDKQVVQAAGDKANLNPGNMDLYGKMTSTGEMPTYGNAPSAPQMTAQQPDYVWGGGGTSNPSTPSSGSPIPFWSGGQSAPHPYQMPDRMALPSGLAWLQDYTDQQRRSSLATRGLYGAGNDKTGEDYYLNLLQQNLMGSGGLNESDLLPIEGNYLQYLNIPYGSTDDFLTGLGRRFAGT